MSTFVDEPQLRLQSVAAGPEPVVSSEADSTSLGRQLLEAIQHVMEEPPWEEPVRVTQELPAKDASPAPFDFEASMGAVVQATTEEEAIAAMKRFLADIDVVCARGTDPFDVLETAFGADTVAAVSEVCVQAVADLAAVPDAAGGTIIERAGSHIARSMIQRLIARAGRTLARAPRAHSVLRVRVRIAPRGRHAPRRAVRLSAVTSAGDGPPAPEPPPTACPRNVVRPARAKSRPMPRLLEVRR